ncbi:MAG: ribosome biogenesis GTP-binding protein YihA/YsxC [Devosiaceae bacterium]
MDELEAIGLSQPLLEAGHQLFARDWLFEKGVVAPSGLPIDGRIEIAFAGRSNVGKSSLLNALVNQKGLARTSNTPGRTQELNLFSADGMPFRIVDMPGYGFAKAPVDTVEKWNKLIRKYLQGRAELARVFVLIDSRHGLKKNDLEIMKMLDETAVGYQIVLTKTDKLKPGQIERVKRSVMDGIAKRPAAYPFIAVTSSEKKQGVDTLRGFIARLLNDLGALGFEDSDQDEVDGSEG